MTATARHKYVVVLGSCCTADAIRPKNFEDIRGAKLRLLWYQGRTSLFSMRTRGAQSGEYALTKESEQATEVDWGLTMVRDELEKRQQNRLAGVIEMSDAILIDVVSAWTFPYLVVQPDERYFLQSEEWVRYVEMRAKFERKRLWDFPVDLSVVALREVLEPLYERQPNLRLIFHLPRPCFNDGVAFKDPELTANIDVYHEYGERLYSEASKLFPDVSTVSCGGEQADPSHYHGPFPFHYGESYMNALRKEIERLLE
jgi:hypothetical protein